MDFERAEGDKVNLSSAFGPAMTFKGTDPFDAAGQVRYDAAPDGAVVKVNLDADAAAELTIKMFGLAAPIATDFIL